MNRRRALLSEMNNNIISEKRKFYLFKDGAFQNKAYAQNINSNIIVNGLIKVSGSKHFKKNTYSGKFTIYTKNLSFSKYLGVGFTIVNFNTEGQIKLKYQNNIFNSSTSEVQYTISKNGEQSFNFSLSEKDKYNAIEFSCDQQGLCYEISNIYLITKPNEG